MSGPEVEVIMPRVSLVEAATVSTGPLLMRVGTGFGNALGACLRTVGVRVALAALESTSVEPPPPSGCTAPGRED